MTSFKLVFDENNIRRISTEKEFPAYEEFIELLLSLYPENYHPELFIRWVDEDGDKIIASSQQEWEHMLQQVKERPIKLYITEGEAPYFKDGPPAEPQYFYTNENEKEECKEEPQFLDRLKSAVPKSLQRLFPNGRILPYNIPLWLKDAIQLKRIGGQEVDFDVDIPKLFHCMHRRSMELLNNAKDTKLIKQAKLLLEDMLTIIPKHAVTLYNLACVESLLGNVKDSLKNLRSAVFDAGYSDYEHMQKDQDLDNIKSTPEFQELVDTLKKKDLPTSSNPIESSSPSIQEEQSTSDHIMQDWTHVEQPEKIEEKNQPILSVGEQKWNEQIELLKGMGFGENQLYFGPRCVVLLEKYNGELSEVINDLLSTM